MGASNSEARIIAVCTSEKRGTKKQEVSEGFLKENFGLLGDAHATSESHRQVSLLAYESMKKMEKKGFKPVPGIFAENITTKGIDLLKLKPGSRISIGGDAILEITQLGKKCHTECEIFRLVGECVMPREGIFARVIKSGKIKNEDVIRILQTGADQ
jgi:MOSC domain-containing protein YiiM